MCHRLKLWHSTLGNEEHLTDTLYPANQRKTGKNNEWADREKASVKERTILDKIRNNNELVRGGSRKTLMPWENVWITLRHQLISTTWKDCFSGSHHLQSQRLVPSRRRQDRWWCIDANAFQLIDKKHVRRGRKQIDTLNGRGGTWQNVGADYEQCTSHASPDRSHLASCNFVKSCCRDGHYEFLFDFQRSRNVKSTRCRLKTKAFA